MQRVPWRLCLFAAVLLALWAHPGHGDAEPRTSGDAPYTVAVVHSYHPDYAWTMKITQGIRDALAGMAVDLRLFYLDAKSHPMAEQLQASAKRIARELRALAPDVVVAADDAAQAYLVVPYLMEKENPQVVFCGVNAPIAHYGYPAANVSGIRERWHVREGFKLLKTLIPRLRSVVFLIDASSTADLIVDDLWADYQQYGPFDLELTAVETIPTWQQWKERIRFYQDKADAIATGLYVTIRDEVSGDIVPADTVMEWTRSVNTLPILGFTEINLRDGMLCGILESGQEQGFRAGQMARRILTDGVAAGSLPVARNTRGDYIVNVKEMERLGIAIPYEYIEAAGAIIQ